jgi:hypothetical protein
LNDSRVAVDYRHVIKIHAQFVRGDLRE